MAVARALALCWLLIASGGLVAADAARPPGQPQSGPGGRAYKHAEVAADRVGEPPTGATLFLRASPPLADADAPLVVFLHGFTAVDPLVYRGWIDHLVRRGAAVVYPDYQTSDPFATDTEAMADNAVAGIRAALGALADAGAPVDAGRMALVGHSLGGVLAATVAARAAAEGLPTPVALAAINPGGCRGCGGPGDEGGVPLPDLGAIPPTTLATIVVSEDDDFVGDAAAGTIWRGLDSIPPERKAYVVLRSDRRGDPDLIADHNAPQTAGRWGGAGPDALDWYGLWKPFDLLLACASPRAGCAEAPAADARWFGMGTWSDGVPVRRPTVTDEPPALGR